MEPITTAAVALAVAQGLSQVGGKLLEKGLLEPALEPAVSLAKSWLGRAVVSRKEDEALRKALRSAMEDYRPAASDTELQVQTLLASLHILTAEKNDALRAEVARALWLMDGPDPSQTPEALPDALGLPSKMRRPLRLPQQKQPRQLEQQCGVAGGRITLRPGRKCRGSEYARPRPAGCPSNEQPQEEIQAGPRLCGLGPPAK